MSPHAADDADTSVSSATISSSTQTTVQGKKDAATSPAKQATPPEGSLSATISGRQWIMGQEAFERKMPHHAGIKALWETKWKFPCTKSVYPFHDGKYEDFEPIFNYLIENNINDGTSQAYTEAFIRAGDSLVGEANTLLSSDPKAASDILLRACTIYRIARFPYITSRPTINDPTKWRAWTAQKEAYMKAASTWKDPVEEVMVPHTYSKPGLGEGTHIPVYLRTPSPKHRRETVILFTGLDGYRPDNTTRCDEFLARNWASVVVEIPGTADCPADPADAGAAERLWDSLLEWMEKDRRFNMERVMVWGLSAGGYYAVRIAHTHARKLIGVVAQGAGTHHFFGREWLGRAEGHEYPFGLLSPLALKHGYSDVEDYLANAQKKFSLLENGILEKSSTRLLLVNGILDGLMPIEDSMMLFEHGSPKEARFFPGTLHMGYPAANGAVYPWMEAVMDQMVTKME
ncbi:pigment biosynthesis protein Ayg1 [Coniochaeta sp. 2T2.1]|nr:pigment biosynthesis protein Ayg1 [Coniochaeta sp. 2T2.1]